jgi:branched-chain amino acid aminotransferase
MEVTPLSEIDGFQIGGGGIGDITSNLEQLFHNVVRNREPCYAHWVTRV